MSSFVINKEEYMKVAGVVSALQNKHNYTGIESGLYLTKYTKDYGYQHMSEEDIIDMFDSFYKLNVDSVSKQYNIEIYSDTNKYDFQFNNYKKMTENFLKHNDNKNIERLVYAMTMFSSSVNYQVEDEEDNKEIMTNFNDIIVRAFNLLARRKHKTVDYWGSFDYITEEEELKRIEEHKKELQYIPNYD